MANSPINNDPAKGGDRPAAANDSGDQGWSPGKANNTNIDDVDWT